MKPEVGYEFTREGDYNTINLPRKTNIESLVKASTIIVSIHLDSNKETTVNNIKAYYSLESPKEEEAKGLACSILNSLSSTLEGESGTSIIPLIPEEAQEEEKQIMSLADNEKKAAIVIKIGNIQGDKFPGWKTTDIGKAIYDGVRGYYEDQNE